MKVKSLSRARLLATPWTSAYQAPPSMGFSRRVLEWGATAFSGQILTDHQIGSVYSTQSFKWLSPIPPSRNLFLNYWPCAVTPHTRPTHQASPTPPHLRSCCSPPASSVVMCWFDFCSFKSHPVVHFSLSVITPSSALFLSL